ncbi:MAG: Gfo/Idh/MocA family oxidoreductase [Rhodothermales bacterium]
MKKNTINRRTFVGQSTAAAFGAIVLPRHVLGGRGFIAPSDTLNVAAIGAGGMGASNMNNLVSQNIVAICDVDDKSVENAFFNNEGKLREERKDLKAAYEKAKRYKDFREMLDKQKDIEGVVIATPDHVHAAAAVMAMKMGKHVYVQKPLTYTVHEARVLRQVAKETGVVTQMGNQGHSHDDGRRMLEWVWAGAIGTVSEVHVWTNRPIWPQGMPRPEKGESVPKTMAWDLFLGPAPAVPYHSSYAPFLWRGWTDWGTGALGDMGAHLIDHAYWALDLDAPTSIEAAGSPFGGKDKASYPLATVVHYEFARGGRTPVKMTWYDGGLLPRRPPEMPAEAEVNPAGGTMLIGDKGVIVYDTYGHNPRLFPQHLEQEYANVPQTLPRIPDSHEINWAKACMGTAEASCPFDYAGPLTETMLLGVVALKAGYGRKLFWDAGNGKFLNAPDADQHLHREYRKGWEL